MPFIVDDKTKMAEMFMHMGDVEFPQLERGQAKSILEFYQNIVQLNELNEDVVRRWWEVLSRYCQPDNDRLVAFVRRYENCRPRTLQRRGFLSVYRNGPRYVFCDNSLADYFYAMAKAGFVPRDDDFSDFIDSRRIPIAVRCAAEEYERLDDGRFRFQAYSYSPTSRPRGLYKRWRHPDGSYHDNKMWYLAHILDVNNPQSYTEEYGLRRDRVLSRGEREDWAYHHGNDDYPYRDMGEDLCEEDRRIIIAHFLRLVNPMNYFLTPQKGVPHRRIQSLVVPGNPDFNQGIQDLPQMQDYMRNRRREQYGDIFEEYEGLAMALPAQSEDNVRLGQMEIDLRYCPPDECLGADDALVELHRNHPVRVGGFDVVYGEITMHFDSMLEVASWVVRQYIVDHPDTGVERIRSTFNPRRMFKALAVARREVNWRRKYPRDPIVCANNERLVVNRNWYNTTNGNWPQFLASARAVGFVIR